MMDELQLIESVGFPRAAFLLTWVFATKTLKENTNAIKELCIMLKSKK